MSDLEKAAEAVSSADPVGGNEAPKEPVGEPGGATEASVAQEWKFDWKDDSGKEFHFTKPAELADHLRQSSMFRQDYDAGMTRVKELSKAAEERQKRYEALERQLAESPAAKYDRWLRENPQAAQALKQQIEQTSQDPKSLVKQMFEEEFAPYKERLSEFEKAEEQRKAQARREKAFERLMSEMPDLDRKAVESKWNRLAEGPPEDLEFQILRMAAQSLVGESGPAEVERKVAQAAERKRNPSVSSAPGGKSGELDVTKLSESEIRDQAAAEIKKMLGQ